MRKTKKIEKTIHHDIFYSSDKNKLIKLINETEEKYKAKTKGNEKVFILPHASYEFILPLLVNTFTHINNNFDRILLIAPSHLKTLEQNSNKNIFIPEYNAIETPLGLLNFDTDFINEMFNEEMKNSTFFEEEPSFEQLYIAVQHYFKSKKIVPICAIIENSNQSKNFSSFLNKILDDRTLVLISANASSYQKNDISYKKAKALISSLESGEKLLQLQKKNIIDCCASGIIDTIVKTKLYKNRKWEIQLIEVEQEISTHLIENTKSNKCVYHISAIIKD